MEKTRRVASCLSGKLIGTSSLKLLVSAICMGGGGEGRIEGVCLISRDETQIGALKWL